MDEAEQQRGIDPQRLARAIAASMDERGYGYIAIDRTTEPADIAFEAERIARFCELEPT